MQSISLRSHFHVSHQKIVQGQEVEDLRTKAEELKVEASRNRFVPVSISHVPSHLNPCWPLGKTFVGLRSKVTEESLSLYVYIYTYIYYINDMVYDVYTYIYIHAMYIHNIHAYIYISHILCIYDYTYYTCHQTTIYTIHYFHIAYIM